MSTSLEETHKSKLKWKYRREDKEKLFRYFRARDGWKQIVFSAPCQTQHDDVGHEAVCVFVCVCSRNVETQ